MEPQSLVLANLLTSLQFDNIANLLTEIAADILVIVDIAKETDTLRVLALGIDKTFTLSNLTNLFLHEMSDREESLLQLPLVYLSKEVGLILHWVRTGCQPFPSVYPFCLGIVSGGNIVIVMTTFVIESPELYESVAHHVRVRGKARLNLLHCVLCHLAPVFLMAIDNFQFAVILLCNRCRHLQVFLRVAVPFFLFLRTNLYIEAVGVNTMSHELIENNRTVDAT